MSRKDCFKKNDKKFIILYLGYANSHSKAALTGLRPLHNSFSETLAGLNAYGA